MCRWGESFSETASQGKGESRRRRFCDDVSEERERRGERRWSVKRHVYKTNYPVIILSRPEPHDNWELNFSKSSYILIYLTQLILLANLWSSPLHLTLEAVAVLGTYIAKLVSTIR